jgi:hypothetical protein
MSLLGFRINKLGYVVDFFGNKLTSSCYYTVLYVEQSEYNTHAAVTLEMGVGEGTGVH